MNKEKSKSFGMNLLFHAIFKFCTTKRLFKYLAKMFILRIFTHSNKHFKTLAKCEKRQLLFIVGNVA